MKDLEKLAEKLLELIDTYEYQQMKMIREQSLKLEGIVDDQSQKTT